MTFSRRSSLRRAAPLAVRTLAAVAFATLAAADVVATDVDLAAAPGAEGRRVVRLHDLFRVGSYYGNGIAFGDHDGDGEDDLILASDDSGEVVIVHGGPAMGVAGTVVDLGDRSDAVTRIVGRQGFSVASGDLDGDGRDDVIVGAPSDGRGRATVFFGTGRERGRTLGRKSSGGDGTEVTATVTYTGSGDRAAWAVACGDVDGDGRADLVIGNPYAERAVAHVVFGSPSLPGSDLQVDDGDAPGAGRAVVLRGFGESTMGWSVAVGDIDGDGTGDIILGDPAAAGRVRLIRGGPHLRGAAVTGGGIVVGSNVVDRAGMSVAAGDVDGDGRDEVLVGAPSHAGVDQATGIAYVLWGHSGLLAGLRTFGDDEGFPDAPATLAGTTPIGFVGYTVAAGDVDGDGRADVAVGAWGDGSPDVEEGRLYVIAATDVTRGARLTSTDGPFLAVRGPAAGDRLGYGTEAGGDLDGDGVGDVATSAVNGRGDTGLAITLLGEAATDIAHVRRASAGEDDLVAGGPSVRMEIRAAGAGVVDVSRERGGARIADLPGALPVLWEVAGAPAALRSATVTLRATAAEFGSTSSGLRAFWAGDPAGPWTLLDPESAPEVPRGAAGVIPGAGFLALAPDGRTPVATWIVELTTPRRAAWVLDDYGDGTVDGYGYDIDVGDVRITGTFDASGDLPTGRLEARRPDGGLVLDWTLAGGAVKQRKGVLRKVVLRGDDQRGTARPAAAAAAALSGRFEGRANVIRIDGAKSRVGDVYLNADPIRTGASALLGAAEGRVVAASPTVGFGEVLRDGVTYRVRFKLKKRSGRLRAKGAGIRLSLRR